ncbi:MAG: LLM class flavin-dependent oxidoreductase [Aerococcus sp.]|nr:LLM class flavin-dependent oxidoreductase [Aerococcus sp.]
MDISVLDYAMIDEGETPTKALANTVALAQHADQLGYKRFWMAEHHNVPAFASSSPALIAMQIAAQTKQIHVGSGGVMLPHYSPLTVAENFRVLEAYYPGRVDLGMGNNPGTRLVKRALHDGTFEGSDYLDAIATVKDYLETAGPIATTDVAAQPEVDRVPEMWMLSTSVANAIQCAKLGISYCYGLFPYAREDGIEVGKAAVKAYREHFQPSASQKAPHTMAAIFVTVAEDDETAKQLTMALDWWLLGRDDFSYFKQFPSLETGAHYSATASEQKQALANRTRMAHGTIKEVTDQLSTLMTTIAADELLVMPLIPGIERRKQALTLLKAALMDK